MFTIKLPLTIAVLATLSACGGAGHVGPGAANRGAGVENEGQVNEVVTRAMAKSFARDANASTHTSTTGTAEVIYGNRIGGQRVQVVNRKGDAEQRARSVTGCTTAITDHVHNSIQGTHVIVGLSQCPPIESPVGFLR